MSIFNKFSNFTVYKSKKTIAYEEQLARAEEVEQRERERIAYVRQREEAERLRIDARNRRKLSQQVSAARIAREDEERREYYEQLTVANNRVYDRLYHQPIILGAEEGVTFNANDAGIQEPGYIATFNRTPSYDYVVEYFRKWEGWDVKPKKAKKNHLPEWL